MNALWLALATYVGFIVAYNTYGKFLANKLFGLDPKRRTPAHELNDGTDYVPTKREVLFGHHFTSIAGTGPIVGPAIAIIWGWVPAMIWIFFGAIFIGAVHDFGSLVLSLRNRGATIGDLAGRLVNPRVKRAFLFIIFLALFIVLAVFALVIAAIFKMFPQSVLAVWMEIPIALWAGYMIYNRRAKLWVIGLVAVTMMYVFVIIGAYVPLELPSSLPFGPIVWWSIILFIYVYIASVLPVHRLLQPRDYINGHELYIVMGLLVIGVVVARPEMVAPAINFNFPALSEIGIRGFLKAIVTFGGVGIKGAPPFLPFLFITIACGAISGFHCMVSSGTTSKQLASEAHAQSIGYGAMLLEGALATMVVIAAGAAIGLKPGTDGTALGTAAFTQHYASWSTAAGLGAKIGAFVEGSAQLLMAIGIPETIAIAIMGVMVASFAGTTLDTATRLQRYIITEIATDLNIKPLQGRHAATLVAVGTAAALSLQKGGTGGMLLWPLFGTTNQLMGALSLLVISVWLAKQRKPSIYTVIPMVFMLTISAWALVSGLIGYVVNAQWHLFVIGMLIAVLEVWMIGEIIAHMSAWKTHAPTPSEEATEGVPGA